MGDRIPASWAKKAWPSLMNLTMWLKNFMDRLGQLEDWYGGGGLEIPKVTWLLWNGQPTVVPYRDQPSRGPEERVGVGPSSDLHRGHEAPDSGRGGFAVSRWCLHHRHEHAGREVECERHDHREVQAEGDVLRHAGDDRPWSVIGQGRLQGAVYVPDLQDGVPRSHLRLQGEPQDQVAASEVDFGWRGPHLGGRVSPGRCARVWWGWRRGKGTRHMTRQSRLVY